MQSIFRSLAVALVVGVGSGGCAAQLPAKDASGDKLGPGRLVQLMPADVAAVHAGVRGTLKDPESARFGEISAAETGKTPGMFTVCGTVNARNSYGGYTGAQPFHGMLISRDGKRAFLAPDIGSTDISRRVIITLCERHSAPIKL